MTGDPNATRARSTVVGVVLVLLAYAVVLSWAASNAPFESGGSLTPVDGYWIVGAIAGFLCGSYLVHPLVHELGHLVVALLLRLPVVGVRVGPVRLGLERHIPDTGGHVLVDLARVKHWMRGRFVLVLLAGGAADLALVPVTIAVAGDAAAPLEVRALALGITVALGLGAVENLLPLAPVHGVTTDGRSVLRWLLRPSSERAKHQLAIDLGRVRSMPPPLIAAGLSKQRTQLRSMIEDPRPEVAMNAISMLIRSRPRGDDGWTDADLVATFAARGELPGEARAAVAGNYALSLALAHVKRCRSLDSVDPSSSAVQRIARLAEVARDAHDGSLRARTALGLARVLQGRPGEGRTALLDVATTESADVQARALAVRAIAEERLGDTASTGRLISAAQRLAPDDALVKHVWVTRRSRDR